MHCGWRLYQVVFRVCTRERNIFCLTVIVGFNFSLAQLY